VSFMHGLFLRWQPPLSFSVDCPSCGSLWHIIHLSAISPITSTECGRLKTGTIVCAKRCIDNNCVVFQLQAPESGNAPAQGSAASPEAHQPRAGLGRRKRKTRPGRGAAHLRLKQRVWRAQRGLRSPRVMKQKMQERPRDFNMMLMQSPQRLLGHPGGRKMQWVRRK
jgi:hypothetical protein